MTKDLRIFDNIDKDQMLILDNCTSSFINQLENGIPITSFKKSMKKSDVELIKLSNYLVNLSKRNDFYEFNKDYFKFYLLPHADGVHRAYDLVLHDHTKEFVNNLEKYKLKEDGERKVRF